MFFRNCQFLCWIVVFSYGLDKNQFKTVCVIIVSLMEIFHSHNFPGFVLFSRWICSALMRRTLCTWVFFHVVGIHKCLPFNGSFFSPHGGSRFLEWAEIHSVLQELLKNSAIYWLIFLSLWNSLRFWETDKMCNCISPYI